MDNKFIIVLVESQKINQIVMVLIKEQFICLRLIPQRRMVKFIFVCADRPRMLQSVMELIPRLIGDINLILNKISIN